MSLIPFQGQRPSSFHPDTLRSVQSAGRLARKFYDWYVSRNSSSAPQLMSAKSRGSGRGGGRSRSSGMQPSNPKDLAVKPPTRQIPSSIPKTITNQVVWDVVKIDFNIATSSVALVETNFRFALSDHPQFASWQALFDQWCLPQYTVTFRSLEAPGGLGKMAMFYTALDFDNVNPLGSIALLEDFGTCQVNNLTTGSVVTRSVRPTIKQGASTAGGNTNFSVLERLWCDCAVPQTVWHGVRSICDATDLSQIRATATLYFAFRNQI